MKNYNIWLNKDREKINISDMSETYILNIINMIIRSFLINGNLPKFSEEFVNEHGLMYIIFLVLELKKRKKKEGKLNDQFGSKRIC